MYDAKCRAKKIKGKWPSGRRRQTVNLLGNSRWFESNLSHFLKTKISEVKNNLTVDTITATLLKISPSDNNDSVLAKGTSPLFFRRNFKFTSLRSLRLVDASLSKFHHTKDNFLRKVVIEKFITPSTFTHLQFGYKLHLNNTRCSFSLKAFEKL